LPIAPKVSHQTGQAVGRHTERHRVVDRLPEFAPLLRRQLATENVADGLVNIDVEVCAQLLVTGKRKRDRRVARFEVELDQ
jgi:hypothetical protein